MKVTDDKMAKLNLTFYGGADGVTGANFMLEKKPSAEGIVDGIKILIDCGMIQGSKFAENLNRSEFKYDPSSIDYLLITHSHIDHIGRIPKLVHDGFISLLDMVRIMSLSPAKAFRLEAGDLAAGAPADLFLFDPAAERTLAVSDLQSRSKNTPFLGKKLRGKVLMTMVSGERRWQQ